MVSKVTTLDGEMVLGPRKGRRPGSPSHTHLQAPTAGWSLSSQTRGSGEASASRDVRVELKAKQSGLS